MWLAVSAVTHLLGEGGNIIIEGIGGAYVAVIGHAGHVGGAWEGGGVSGRAGGELTLLEN